MCNLDIVASYLSTGLRLIAVSEGSKKPAFRGWNQPGTGLSRIEQLDGVDASRWSWGLHHLDSGTMALDIDDLAEARWIFFEHGIDLDLLLSTCLGIDSGKPNHAKLLFRMPAWLPSETSCREKNDPAPGRKAHTVLDFRCTTRDGLSEKDMLPPSIHPDTQQPYSWVNDLGLGPFMLEEVPLDLLCMWQALLERRRDDSERLPASGVAQPGHATPERVASALAFVDPDCSRDDWVLFAMAIHNACGEEGYPLFEEWSSRGGKYAGQQDALAVWRSLHERPHGVTYKTLWKAAIGNGWTGHAPTFEEMKTCWEKEPEGGGGEPSAPSEKQQATELVEKFEALGPGNEYDDNYMNGVREVLLGAIRLSDPVHVNRVLDLVKKSMKWSQKRLQGHLDFLKKNLHEFYQDAPGELMFPFTDSNGNPSDHSENFRAIMKHRGIQVRHNRMVHDIEVLEPSRKDWFFDEKLNLQRSFLRDKMVEAGMPIGRADEHMNVIASEHSYHPFVDMLDNASWDGQDWFETVASTVTTTDPALWRLTLMRWAISVAAVAREAYGDYPPRGMLVMTGVQYTGKTTFFRYLVPEGMFGEGAHLDLTNKDQIKTALSKLVVELGELDHTFKKTDISRLKAFIGSPQDEVRLPYAHRESRWKRRTVFCGTVNDPQFLADPTGNTRFWVNNVLGVDLDRMQELRDTGALLQFWAHMDYMLRIGERWYMLKDEIAAIEKRNEQYLNTSVFEEMILEAFAWPENFQKDPIFGEDHAPEYTPVNPMTLNDVARVLGIGLTNGNQATTNKLRQALTRMTGQRTITPLRHRKLDLVSRTYSRVGTSGRFYHMPYLRGDSQAGVKVISPYMSVIDGGKK